jgi:hypothetical protein
VKMLMKRYEDWNRSHLRRVNVKIQKKKTENVYIFTDKGCDSYVTPVQPSGRAPHDVNPVIVYVQLNSCRESQWGSIPPVTVGCKVNQTQSLSYGTISLLYQFDR